MKLHRLLAVCAVGAGVLFVPSPAIAGEECHYDDVTRQLRCTITAEPGGPSLTVAIQGVPLVWSRTLALASPVAGGCWYTDTVEGTETRTGGIPWLIEVRNVETGELVLLDAVCEYPGEDPPAPPPPPPTPEQFIETIADLLVVHFDTSPDGTIGGITGLDTWLWCDTPDPVSTPPITLNGWTVTAEMEAVLFHWSISGQGPGGSHDSTECGTEPAEDSDGAVAAWIWRPEATGDYTIAFAASWAGTWTLTYDGTDMGIFVLDPALIDAPPITYSVGEYIGVLTD